MSDEPTRILVEPEGTAVVLRTPFGRSARFRSVDDALAWTDAQSAVVLPVFGAGLVATALRWIVAPEVADALLVPVLAIGVGLAWFLSWRAPRPPEPTWLTWEASVRLDPRPHPLSHVARDLGVAAGCVGLLGLVGALVWDGGGDDLRDGGLGAVALAVVFCAALCVGVGFGVFSAWQRVRFHRDQKRLWSSPSDGSRR